MQAEALSPADLAWICELVRRRAGIALDGEKHELVRSRVAQQLRRRRLPSCRAYLELVRGDRSGAEAEALVDALTTNFTEFFREGEHFDILARQVLPPLVARGGGVRIWSAASSTGEEPLSIAMEVLESPTPPGAFLLLATDLSDRVLAAARAGLYPLDRAARSIPPQRLHRWFQRGQGANAGQVRARPELVGRITYRKFNLLDSPLPEQRFHAIFVRNVMIYFDAPTRAQVVTRLCSRLEPGGWLFIGRAESLIGVPHALQTVRPSVYRAGGAR